MQVYERSLETAELTVEEGRKAILGMALAMRWAHAAGLAHGDLKPGNVLLDREGVPKICGFGLGRAVNPNGEKGITPYTAPEIENYTKSTEEMDVFSFGCIVYKITEGQAPSDSIITLDLLLLGLPFEASDNNPYKELIKACTSEDPDERPSFDSIARELCSDLSDEEYAFVQKVRKAELSSYKHDDLSSIILRYANTIEEYDLPESAHK